MAVVSDARPATGRPVWRRTIAGATQQGVAVTLAMGFLALLVVSAIFAPLVAPHDPAEVDLTARLAEPAWVSGGTSDHLLGADALGRDLLSRMIYGARISLIIGLAVVVLAGVIGTILGLVAGYFGGFWDSAIMRLTDMQLAFPSLVLVIAVISVLSPSVPVLIGILTAIGWMIFARVVRGAAMQLRDKKFVRAAEFAGCSRFEVIRRHFVPALFAPLVTQGLLEFAHVVLAESSLSYLGLGIQPPEVSWGLMVAENRLYIESGWWTVFFPGLALALTVLSLNLVGSWLRVQLDPQQTRRIERTAPTM